MWRVLMKLDRELYNKKMDNDASGDAVDNAISDAQSKIKLQPSSPEAQEAAERREHRTSLLDLRVWLRVAVAVYRDLVVCLFHVERSFPGASRKVLRPTSDRCDYLCRRKQCYVAMTRSRESSNHGHGSKRRRGKSSVITAVGLEIPARYEPCETVVYLVVVIDEADRNHDLSVGLRVERWRGRRRSSSVLATSEVFFKPTILRHLVRRRTRRGARAQVSGKW